MAAFTLPRSLVVAAEQDDLPDRRDWMATLPATVAELSERWSLRLYEPYQPGGQCSWVAPAIDAAGRPRVLKVGWNHVDNAHEPAALQAIAGGGAVLVHEVYADAGTSAMLLERCQPGTTLADSRPEAEQDEIVAGLLRRFWAAPVAGPFRSLTVMCTEWAAEFDERFVPGVLDPGLARAGMALFRGLPADAVESALLWTDLHAENVLAAEREPWLAIDPKPYVGDRAYDVLQHLLNCRERLATDPVGLAARMAGLLDLDPLRVTRWLFARCVQESVGVPRFRAAAIALAPAAEL